MISRIVRLDRETALDAGILGGKGENLVRLFQGGFPVPSGFLIVGEAYLDFIRERGLEEEIQARLVATRREAPDALRESVSSIEALFNAGDIPKSLKREINDAYISLGAGRVAVRSSASTEDLSEASFAGLHDTYLNIEGEEALLQAVASCWASLWNEGAVAYREERGFEHTKTAMCVVVQKMVESTASGVMFTRDPGGKTENILIESTWGLGEALVSGRVKPDRYEIDRESGEIKHKNLGSKELTITSRGEQPTSPEFRERYSLSEQQAGELYFLGRKVEEHFGSPQDIEWALSNHLYILQSRPITAMTDKTELEKLVEEERERLREIAGDGEVVWSRKELMEVLTVPYPMTWAILTRMLLRLIPDYKRFLGISPFEEREIPTEEVLELVCGWPAYNITGMARVLIGELPISVDPDALVESGFSVENVKLRLAKEKIGVRFFTKIPKYVIGAVIAAVKFRKARKTYHRRYYEEILPAYLEHIAGERKIELSGMSEKEVLGKTLEWIDYYSNEAFWPHMESELFIYTQSIVMHNLKLIFGPRGDEMMTRLLRGLEGNVNVETNIDLWRLSQEEMTMEEFLERYGHRAGYEIELANPRWREDPGFVLKMAKALKQSRGIDPNQRFETQRKDRLKAERELRKALRGTFLKRAVNPWRWNVMREVKFLQLYFPLRETSKINALIAGELVRKGLLELGRRSGLEEDIFYLVPSELELLVEGEDFIPVVEERRRSRELMLKVEVPIIVYSDHLDEIGNLPPPSSARVLEGLSVSTGVVEGEARVILDPHEAEALEEGQIMVAPATDPAWSPLFIRAAGLVMDTGGVLSHSSIIAREYGIPAVVDVGDATRVITDGQRLRVDAKAGKVYILEEE